MYLRKSSDILKVWHYAVEQGAHIVFIRHGPKSGSDESDLSKQGRKVTTRYGQILRTVWPWRQSLMFHSLKLRTVETLRLLFPGSAPKQYRFNPKLNSPPISEKLQEQIDCLHYKLGRWRGYSVNHTYCFLENLGGQFPDMPSKENIRAVVGETADGIAALLEFEFPVFCCGHSPSLELAIAQVLGVDLLELGGFLNPLDSIHLKLIAGKPVWIARCNPIRDYIDLESQEYLKKR